MPTPLLGQLEYYREHNRWGPSDGNTSCVFVRGHTSQATPSQCLRVVGTPEQALSWELCPLSLTHGLTNGFSKPRLHRMLLYNLLSLFPLLGYKCSLWVASPLANLSAIRVLPLNPSTFDPFAYTSLRNRTNKTCNLPTLSPRV